MHRLVIIGNGFSFFKTSLNIPEAVNRRRTENATDKKDTQCLQNATQITKDLVPRTPLKPRE